MKSETKKSWPRLFVNPPLQEGLRVDLPGDQSHYLLSVLRKRSGEYLRLFNGKDGEWAATLDVTGKKSAAAALEEKLLEQPRINQPLHLIFAPIKKQRMDFMIEKAAELGATHLHPVLTQNGEVRQINTERVTKQLIEASEQCERMSVPEILPLKPLREVISNWDHTERICACVERVDAPRLSEITQERQPDAILVGPEGGFTEEEKAFLLERRNVAPVSLGAHILRAETATIAALAFAGQKPDMS